MSLLKNQKAAEKVDSSYLDLESMLMKSIVWHLKGYEQPIDSDRWLLQKLAEIGRLNKENMQLIAKMAGVSNTAAERMLQDMAEEAIQSIDPGLRNLAKRNLVGDPVTVSKSKNVRQAMGALEKQAKDILNKCNTTMLYKARDAYKKLVHDITKESKEIANKQEFLDILNKNATAATVGAESRQQAMRKCIQEFNEKGIPAFVDKRGREWTPESYVNMAMRNTARQTAEEVQTARCKDMGVNLIAIDSHSGARPKCAKDQGKIFSLDNTSGETEDAAGRKIKYYPWNSSSYGEPDGILGINCGHHKFPFVPGENIHRYFPTEDLDANNKLYQDTQVQRALERDVRKQKRECMLYDEIGDADAFERASIELKQKEVKLKAYVDSKDHLHRRKDREQVVGFDKRVSAEAVAANKSTYNRFVAQVGNKNAPTFAKYSSSGYTKSEEYKNLKALVKYREAVPNADLQHLKMNERLHSEKLIRGNVVPIEKKPAYILEDLSNKRDPAHIMKRMLERNITDDQIQSYVDNAELCVSQFKGTRLVYYSKEGVTVLTRTNDYEGVEWIAKTTWSKQDFDENTERILEVVLNVQPL